MIGIDFKTFINGVGNDLKTSIDDVISIILAIQEDVESLKVKTSKPNKAAAKALLEYIAMEDSKTKENLEALCREEIKQCMKWLDNYCEENGTTKEQTLQEIIKGEV